MSASTSPPSKDLEAQAVTAVRVTVMPKAGVNDPEGEAIYGGLHSLGYGGVHRVRAGRVFYLEIHSDREDDALAKVEEMCHRLLTNPVIQSYRIEAVANDDVSADRGAASMETACHQ